MVAALDVRLERFLAIGNQFHRALEQARGPHDHRIFRMHKIFMPKPPPTSPVRTRSLGEPILRIMSATTGRIMLTPCEETHRVERSSLGSYAQIAPRGSIELTTRRLLTICSLTTLSALADTPSAVARLPPS